MTRLSRLTALLASIASWPARVASARASFRALAAMDARELADIGLTPADLNDATALPLAADPTVFLAERAVARRREREGRANPAGKSRKAAPVAEIRDAAERGWARRA